MIWPWNTREHRGACDPRNVGRHAACALILALLTACSRPASESILPEDVLSQGAGIYEQLCATCHYDGRGGPLAPALLNSPVLKVSAEAVIGTILHGRKGTFLVKGKPLEGGMPAQDNLSDEDIAAVVTYVRHEFARVDQLTTTEDVARLR
jgi:mono/diheme cytochrome c family protein